MIVFALLLAAHSAPGPSDPGAGDPGAGDPVAPARDHGPILQLPPESDGNDDDDDKNGERANDGGDDDGFKLPQGVGLGSDVADHVLLRGLQDMRLQAGHTVVGGYGQINGTALSVGPSDDGGPINNPNYSASVRRFVLFVAHTFGESGLAKDLRFYGELEWENAIACRTCVGSVEIEQGFVEWSLVKRPDRDLLALRAGLLIIPIGIINQWHEPPVFHGVERPRVEEGAIIPTTWRELGAGVTGQPLPGLRYEAYLTTGLDPTGITPEGFVGARSNGGRAPAQTLQISTRVELEPTLGFLVGASGIAGDLGGSILGARSFFDVNGDPLPLVLPIYAWTLDARVRRFGVEAKALIGGFHMPNAGDLMQARRADGSLLFPVKANTGSNEALPQRTIGLELEVAYDVLRPLQVTEQQLLPFVRLEVYDGHAEVPDGFERNPALSVRELTAGLSWRPIQQVVIKADVQARNRRLGLDEAQGNVGVGFMF